MTNSLALVVDDIADNRELFERVLELAGYTTTGAKNGQEALDILEKTDLSVDDIGSRYAFGQWQRGSAKVKIAS